MIPENLQDIIDSLIAARWPFAIWRIPGETELRFIAQTTGQPQVLYDIKELNGRHGFVIAPFQVSRQKPIFLINPDRYEIPKNPVIVSVTEANSPDEKTCLVEIPEHETKAEYIGRLNRFLEPLKRGELSKLVLSRCRTIPRQAGFSPGKAFVAAEKRYIRSYVYLCHLPEIGTWMGSTPEILLAGERNRWQTVALAGTQPLVDGHLPESWSNKNWREQQFVAYYIRQQLAALGMHPDEEGPFTVQAGEMAHLKSLFSFTLDRTDLLGDLLERLHPTPAVCGLPKEEAYRFILREEGYDRSYYSGFVGWLDPAGKTDLYVNLRCMNIQSHALTLFAGGGILPDSIPDDEWQETKDKMETMRRLLAGNGQGQDKPSREQTDHTIL